MFHDIYTLENLTLEHHQTLLGEAELVSRPVRDAARGAFMARLHHTNSRDVEVQPDVVEGSMKLPTQAWRLHGWLRVQLQSLLGWNVQDVLPGPHHDLIFPWPGELSEG